MEVEEEEEEKEEEEDGDDKQVRDNHAFWWKGQSFYSTACYLADVS